MNTFKLNEKLEIVCEYKKTRNGFKHEATLLEDGGEVEKTKACYLNRTWEAYEYDSVISKLLGKYFKDKDEVQEHLAVVLAINEHKPSPFASVAMVAQMGEIFGKTQAEKNDWKARMLKAGLADKGLVMPEDWDTLSEDEKERRLNGAIKEIA